MNDPLDLLQVKIDRAKASLPKETREAVEAVDWKAAILKLREKHGYNFEQLGDLEIETELLLSGLLSPEAYPKELENRMKLPRAQIDILVNDMNELVFKKIKEELIKNIEKSRKSENTDAAPKKIIEQPTVKQPEQTAPRPPEPKKIEEGNDILKQAGIEIMPTEIEGAKGAPSPTPSFSTAKLNDDFKIPTTKTEYTLNTQSENSPSNNNAEKNIQDSTPAPQATPKVDPYRMPIE